MKNNRLFMKLTKTVELIKKNILLIGTLFYLLAQQTTALGRSIHRPANKYIPSIEVCYLNKKNEQYFLRNSHLEEYPIFETFDKKLFDSHILPQNNIVFRNQTQSISGKKLNNMLEFLFVEVQSTKNTFKDFIILKKSNFNKKSRSGLLILKFKDYPFVVKLFIESPKTFVLPYSKGIVPRFFFNMGGGINRHLLGFTRIKNLEQIKKMILKDPVWSQRVDTPRKWFWTARECRQIEICGKNIGGKKNLSIHIPSAYCIVADAIESKGDSWSVFNKEARQTCMKLCNFLNLAIDPHIDNFIVEKKTNKLVIVDTEHFPTVVGFKQDHQFSGYFSWYCHLAYKCLRDMFFKTKSFKKN